MNRRYITLLALISLIKELLSQDTCTQQLTCDKCLQSFAECAWCADGDWEETRCFSNGAFYIKKTCQNLMHVQSSVEVIADEPLGNVIQVSPQQLNVHLRPKMPITQTISVRPKKGYPIDTYYLMDFSYSMKDDLESLLRLAANLTEEFKTISKDFTIGLGSFNDKVALPYSYVDKDRIEDPCDGEKIKSGPQAGELQCQPSYSFRNEMKMSSKLSDFTSTLEKLKVSANIDNDEGGLDALMQVLACKSIGFRKNSRKVVIYMTDQASHIAGDGKLGGIVVPNDGECYTQSSVPGNYLNSSGMDYPSIEQINRKLVESDVIPIFAVGDHVLKLYQELSDHLTQLSSVGQLSSDGSNLVDVVRESLKRITTTINLVILDAIGIKVDLEPLCRQKNGTNACSGVKFGQTVKFNVTFSFEECNENTPERLTIPIIVTGFSTILVEVTTQCKCSNCDTLINSDKCTNHGDFVCGACKCDEDYYGHDCSCLDGQVESKENIAKCSATSKDMKKKTQPQTAMSTSRMVCSAGGRCECGRCNCRQPVTPPGSTRPYVVYGDYCQCNNYDCSKGINGEICSGNGFCNCGLCDCNVTALGVPKDQVLKVGDACDCLVSQEGCKNDDGEICSGNGECVCGKCECGPKHRGKYCQICDLCGPLNCQTHIDCVLCRTLRLDADKGETCSEYCNTPSIETEKYVVVEDVDPITYAQERNYQLVSCGENNDNETDCIVRFYIALKNKTDIPQSPDEIDYEVLIDAVVWCDDKMNPVFMVVAIVSALLVPCMFALVIWKMVIAYHDKQEYMKFEELNKKAQWKTMESPIYHGAVTTYQNPAYQKIGDDRGVKRGSSIRRNLSFLRRNGSRMGN